MTLLRVILSESGIDPDKVTVVQFAVQKISEMAHDIRIDAYMSVGPLDSKITSEAIAATARERGEPKFLPIDVSEAIAQKHPLYESEEIPGSIFSSSPARPDDKIETVSVNHLIVARRALSETAVGGFTRQLFSVRQALARELPGAANIAPPDTDKDAALPAHRGAAAYIDGTERTFLEKYSDYIWGGILLLSGLGSAGAWFRSYLKRDEKAESIALRDRVLTLAAQARDGQSSGELRGMQSEVDNIIRETLTPTTTARSRKAIFPRSTSRSNNSTARSPTATPRSMKRPMIAPPSKTPPRTMTAPTGSAAPAQATVTGNDQWLQKPRMKSPACHRS